MAIRRSWARLCNNRNHNRYSSGTGRQLEPNSGPEGNYLEPLNNPRLKNAYPVRAGHFQVAIRGEPTPFKGKILVSGAGVIGSAVATMFALRGWHTTVIEQQPIETTPGEISDNETVLITRRALDALHVAGVRKEALVAMGTRVTGYVDHPGTVASPLTYGLSETSIFAVNMLCVPLKTLRHSATMALQSVPHGNTKIFHSHKLVAVIPDAKTAVVKPLVEEHAAERGEGEANTEAKEVVIAGRKFEDNVEGIDFDVMVAADGLDSPTRRLLEFEDVVKANTEFSRRWFFVTGAKHLDTDCIQRWCHKFTKSVAPSQHLGTVFAYPRGNDGDFAIMAHMPTAILQAQTAEQFVRAWCPELLPGEVVEGSASPIKPAYTLFCEDLVNEHNMFPNVCLLGDASAHCHPFLNENLGCALTSAANLVNNIDSTGLNLWDCARQYGRETGESADCLRLITERSLFYAHQRHWNPLVRMRNAYMHAMHYLVPLLPIISEEQADTKDGRQYSWYPRPLELQLHGRGYASYKEMDDAQHRTTLWWRLARLYT